MSIPVSCKSCGNAPEYCMNRTARGHDRSVISTLYDVCNVVANDSNDKDRHYKCCCKSRDYVREIVREEPYHAPVECLCKL